MLSGFSTDTSYMNESSYWHHFHTDMSEGADPLLLGRKRVFRLHPCTAGHEAITFHPSCEMHFVSGWLGSGAEPLTWGRAEKPRRVQRPGCHDHGRGSLKRLFFSWDLNYPLRTCERDRMVRTRVWAKEWRAYGAKEGGSIVTQALTPALDKKNL